ncbi:MAG: PfkB family carbohydrate kinase [Pseudomonadota bacterium]
MNRTADILCIGSVLWDMIARVPGNMRIGADAPGRIVSVPGGVALNIAMTLARCGLTPALLSVVGRDPAGDALIAACEDRGLITDLIYRSDDLPTDQYLAIEAANGLIAAVADARSLEFAEDNILNPLVDGTLATQDAPYMGLVALDGNLTAELMANIATSPVLVGADLRVAPASPGKADRLAPFLTHGRGTLYVNLEEAGILCQHNFDNSSDAAAAMLEAGARRVLVTDGGNMATEGSPAGLISATPPPVTVTRVTGAGDTCMATHISAEVRGVPRKDALTQALEAGALYASGHTPI